MRASLKPGGWARRPWEYLRSTLTLALLVALPVFLPSCKNADSKPRPSDSEPRVLARVSGEDVPENTLDSSREIEDLEGRLFQLMLGAVGRAIEEKLLAEQAKKRGVEAQALLVENSKPAQPSAILAAPSFLKTSPLVVLFLVLKYPGGERMEK